MSLNLIEKEKFIVILRHINPEDIKKTVKALYDGGVRIIEVTFNPSDSDTVIRTQKSINTINEIYGNEICVGAGTVLTNEYADAAFNAGAKFIVSPCTNYSIMSYTKEKNMLSIPGAYTPTEIMNAYEHGADLVKIFPILPHEVDYLKTIMQPLSHIKFIPTGGINEKSINSFMKTGATAVAAGIPIVNADLVASEAFDTITQNALLYTKLIKDYEGGL